MEDVFKMTIYGSSFFRCNQKGAHNLPENIILGVQHDVSLFLLLAASFISLSLTLSISLSISLSLTSLSLFSLNIGHQII